MTSRTSSWPEIHTGDLQRELTKRRVWILAVTILAYVSYYILGTILVLARARRTYYLWYEYDAQKNLSEYLATSMRGWVGINSATVAFTVAIAVVTACASFFFLYKTQAVDFYMSQPITRRRQYLNIYVNGIIGYAALTLVFTLISLGVAACMRAVTGSVVIVALFNLARNLLLYLAVYHAVILAVLICRNHLTAIIVAAIFLAAEPLIRVLAHSLMDSYFATYYDVTWILGTKYTAKPCLFSPIMNHINGAGIWTENVSDNILPISGMWRFDLMTLIFAVAVGTLAYVAYIYRRAEDIGTGLTYPWIKNVLKMIVAIPMAVTGAALVDIVLEDQYSPMSVMSVVVLIFVAAIVCMVTEMICGGHLKAALRGAWHIAIAAGCALFVFCIFKYDLLGYDRYIPDITDVEDAALCNGYSFREMYDEDGSYIDNTEYRMLNMHLTDISTVCAIAQAGQEAQRHNCECNYDNADYIRGNDATVVYHMKNGDIRVRYLTIPADIDPALMDRIIGSTEYRRATFGIEPARTMTKLNKVQGSFVYDVGYDSAECRMGYGEFGLFLDCYNRDLAQYDYTLASTEFPLGSIRYNSDYMGGSSVYFTYTYEVYACYERTLGFLKDHGLYLEPAPDPSLITQVELHMTVYDEETDTALYDCYGVFEDRDDIDRVVDHIITANDYDWMIPDDISYITVTYLDRSGDDGKYESTAQYGGSINTSDIPEDMQETVFENIVYDYSQYN